MEEARLDVPGGIASIAFSVDGSCFFAGTNDMTVDVFDAKRASLLRRVKVDNSNGRVDRFLVSTDGGTIVGVNVSAGTLQRVEVWDGTTGQRRFSLMGRYRVALSADGRRLATLRLADSSGAAARNKLQLWHTQTGSELAVLGDMQVSSSELVLNRDGTRLAVMALPDNSGKQDIRLIEAGSGRPMLALADAPAQTAAAREWGRVPAAFSADGTMFLAAGEDGDGPCVKVWSTADGKEISTIRVKHTIHAAGFTTDASSLILAMEDHVLHVVDRATGAEQQRLVGHSDAITDLTFASGGTVFASASFDNTVRLWHPGGGSLAVRVMQAGSSATLSGAYVSPDRRVLVTLMTPPDVAADGRPRNPSVVTLDGWDPATGRRLSAALTDIRKVVSVLVFIGSSSHCSEHILFAKTGEPPRSCGFE
jgi:WD40 repeat protein